MRTDDDDPTIKIEDFEIGQVILVRGKEIHGM
jgi:hypothetical protein